MKVSLMSTLIDERLFFKTDFVSIFNQITANNIFRKQVDLNRPPGFIACAFIVFAAAFLLILVVGPSSRYFNVIRAGGLAYGFGILVVVFPMAAAEVMFKQDELNGQIDLLRLSMPNERQMLAGYVWASLHRGRVLFSFLLGWAIAMCVSMLTEPLLFGWLAEVAIIFSAVLWYMSVILWSGVLSHMRVYFMKWEYDRKRGVPVTRIHIVRFVALRSTLTLTVFASLLVLPLILMKANISNAPLLWLGGMLVMVALFVVVVTVFWQVVGQNVLYFDVRQSQNEALVVGDAND